MERRIFLWCLIVFYFNTASAGIIDSLEIEIATKVQNEQHLFELSSSLGKAYLKEFNYSEASKHLTVADSIAEKLNLKAKRFLTLIDLGQAQFSVSDYSKAIESFQLVIEKGKTFLKENEIANLYTQLAKTYQATGNHDKAYDYQLSALSIRESQNDSVGIAQCQYEIGTIFFYQTNYELALKYYKKSLDLCEALNNQGLIYSCLGAIGGVYGRMEENELSLSYNQKAYQLAKDLNYDIGIAYSAHNIGGVYIMMEQYDEALNYLNQSMDYKLANNDKWGQVNGMIMIAKAYKGKGAIVKSIGELYKAKMVAEEINSPPRMLEVYEELALTLALNDDYKEAFHFAGVYNQMKDSLLNEQTLASINDAQSKYEVLQKENALLIKEKELVSLYWKGGILAGILLILLVWLSFNKYRTQKLMNEELAIKNHHISHQNKELEIAYKKQEITNGMLEKKHRQIKYQNNRLAHSNNELQRFAYIASHDLKEPLRNIGSYASLLKRRYSSTLNEEANEFIGFITKGVEKMYNLLNDVLEYSKIENDEKKIQEVDLNEVIETVISNLKNQIIEKNVSLEVKHLPNINANKVHLIQIFQNLVSNGIKYSDKENPKIKIGAEMHESEILFTIKDNGIGMEMEYKDKVFEIFQRLHGEDEYLGTGVGLAICKKIVNQYGGSIWVESEPRIGSIFYFTLPIDSKKNIFEMEAYAS